MEGLPGGSAVKTRTSNTGDLGSIISWKGFRCGSGGKQSTCNVGHLGSIPGLGRSSREGKGYPLQYFCLENSMHCIVHGVANNRIQLSDFHYTK